MVIKHASIRDDGRSPKVYSCEIKSSSPVVNRALIPTESECLLISVVQSADTFNRGRVVDVTCHSPPAPLFSYLK